MQARITNTSSALQGIVLLLATALLLSSAAASGQARRLLQEDDASLPANDADMVASAAAAAPLLKVSQPGPEETFELPAGFDPVEFVYKSATRRAAIEGDSGADAAVSNARGRRPRPIPARGSRGTPQEQTVTAAAAAAEEAAVSSTPTSPVTAATSTAATDDDTVATAASAGIIPVAWCPNPATNYAATAENYDACVVLARQSNGARIPWCTAFFVNSKGSANNIALTAGHCVSDSKGKFILDTGSYGGIHKESIICCAYDTSTGSGACPTAYSYKIRNYKLYSSYHSGGRRSHDMAVVAAYNSPTGRIPGKWNLDNWDTDSGSRDWWVYGYPQYDSRYATCQRDFYGRRWVWGLNGPVINQPSSGASYMYGSSCGGLSGAPVYDSRRRTITSVLVASDLNCDSSGWGRISTTAIRGIPGGSTGLSDAWSGVDVYSLWQGM